MKTSHILEGYGPLDIFLVEPKYKIARKKMKSAKKDGRILDVGRGYYPLFLTTVDFEEKYELDKNIETSATERIKEQQMHNGYQIIQGTNNIVC